MNKPHNTVSKLRTAPGFYDVTIKMVVSRKMDARGNAREIPTMQVVDIDYVGAVDAQIKEPKVQGKIA
jgi:hypothetical protein